MSIPIPIIEAYVRQIEEGDMTIYDVKNPTTKEAIELYLENKQNKVKERLD